jgi:hypothetical protein
MALKYKRTWGQVHGGQSRQCFELDNEPLPDHQVGAAFPDPHSLVCDAHGHLPIERLIESADVQQ